MPQSLKCQQGWLVGAAPTPQRAAAAGRCCWSWRSTACCCCMATAQHSQAPHKTPVSPFTVQLTTAVLPELTYFCCLQCQSFSCWKVQVILKKDPLGFQKFTIRWFKREDFKTKEHHTGTQVVPQECSESTKGTLHIFFLGKKTHNPVLWNVFLKTDLENEIEGYKLVANKSKKGWNVGNQLQAQAPSKTSWIAGTVINYSFHFCILQVKTALSQAWERESKGWPFKFTLTHYK